MSVPGISPSRAGDFSQCPLLYRLRSIDKIPEPPQRATSLGTLVHAVLEQLFDLPAAERTPASARKLLAPAWEALVARDARLADLVADSAERAQFMSDAQARLGTYFTVENPERLEPHARELMIEAQLEGGPSLRGIIDRLDVAPDGAIRVVDYKTGATPRPAYGQQAQFQMRFYALLVSKSRGVMPSLLRLLYLRDGGVKDLVPTQEDLESVETEVRALWDGITARAAAGSFEPRPSRLCSWCSFQALCPEFGGTTPPLDPQACAAATGVTPHSAG